MARRDLQSEIRNVLKLHEGLTYKQLSVIVGSTANSVKCACHRMGVSSQIVKVEKTKLPEEVLAELRRQSLQRCDDKHQVDATCNECGISFKALKRSKAKYCNRACARVGAGNVKTLRYKANGGIKLAKKRACDGSRARKHSVKRLHADRTQLDRFNSQMEPWMTWGNRGRDTWHVDHVVPLCKFDLNDPAQWEVATAPSNLQPLSARDNQSKGGQ